MNRVAMKFFFSSRRRHTSFYCDWSSDVCSSDLAGAIDERVGEHFTRAQVRVEPRVLDARAHRRDVRRGSAERLRLLDERLGGVDVARVERRSEERRVGKECRTRWSAYH